MLLADALDCTHPVSRALCRQQRGLGVHQLDDLREEVRLGQGEEGVDEREVGLVERL